ncbi:MAG TPA: HNH endonuclease, partial [Anaeromyxobacter sp.]
HVVPRGQGGPSTVENTRCLCRFHNQLAAREVYGDAWMDRFTRGGTAGESVSVWSVSRPTRERMPLEAGRARLHG